MSLTTDQQNQINAIKANIEALTSQIISAQSMSQTAIDALQTQIIAAQGQRDTTVNNLQSEINTQQAIINGIANPPINPTLQQAQQAKILALNSYCNQLIQSGFPSSATGVSHQYKFDMEYQGNMSQDGTMLALDPTIDSVPWPTINAGVVPHTRDQFIQLCKDAKTWKDTNVYHYFALKAQVLAVTTTTVDQVNAINW